MSQPGWINLFFGFFPVKPEAGHPQQALEAFYQRY